VTSASKVRSGSGTSAGSQARARGRPAAADRDPAESDRAVIGSTGPQVSRADQPVSADGLPEGLGRAEVHFLQQHQARTQLAQQIPGRKPRRRSGTSRQRDENVGTAGYRARM
jgi:hypothetical protein